MQQAIDWSVETMKAACDYSAEKGIMLGLEDHGKITNSADVCLEIMQRVNSPYAGITLDITHFISTPARDAYEQIAACMPYATVAHIRDQWDDGKLLDLDRVWRLFAEAGHKGFMSVEYSPPEGTGEPAITGVPKLIAKVQDLCRKYSSV